jgi:hypothetical protein
MVCLRSFAILVCAVAWSASLGCPGPRIKAPKFDPETAARQAMSEFDTNKDGGLDAGELAKCPGLLAAKGSIPPDAKGLLTASAIAARLKAHQDSQDDVKPVSFRVLLDGKPLANAAITLVPEQFLGPTLRAAVGVTAQGGDAIVSSEDVAAKGFAGVHCGLYRVQISCRDAAGKEQVPAKYNTETTLGLEVAPGAEREECRLFRLSSASSGS